MSEAAGPVRPGSGVDTLPDLSQRPCQGTAKATHRRRREVAHHARPWPTYLLHRQLDAKLGALPAVIQHRHRPRDLRSLRVISGMVITPVFNKLLHPTIMTARKHGEGRGGERRLFLHPGRAEDSGAPLGMEYSALTSRSCGKLSASQIARVERLITPKSSVRRGEGVARRRARRSATSGAAGVGRDLGEVDVGVMCTPGPFGRYGGSWSTCAPNPATEL